MTTETPAHQDHQVLPVSPVLTERTAKLASPARPDFQVLHHHHQLPEISLVVNAQMDPRALPDQLDPQAHP